MGYETTYKVKTMLAKRADKLALMRLKLSDNPYDRLFWEMLFNKKGCKTKFYEHEEYLCRISANLPDVVFILMGKGSDRRDVWVKIYYGGNHEKRWAINPGISFFSSKKGEAFDDLSN